LDEVVSFTPIFNSLTVVHPHFFHFLTIRMFRTVKVSHPELYCLSSFFYTKLVELGPPGVIRWTKNENIFNKKLIFIPINGQNHWSLLVVINPGCVGGKPDGPTDVCSDDSKTKLSCMLFFDSLHHHKPATISRIVHGWLDSEWGRHHGQPSEKGRFNHKTLPLFSDLGCKYFYFCIYHMRLY
jgi:Ulp1 family protease